MSSISALSPTPFCDLNFQAVRVVADAISRLCLAIFYKVVSYLTWIVSESHSHHYHSLANYHFNRINDLVTYFTFHSYIIDFATNSSTKVSDWQGETGLEAIKRLYGEKAVEHWVTIGNEEIPLKQEDLRQREMGNDGCCLGISFDFISHYLDLVAEGKTPLEAVKEVAPRYAEGATDVAQLAQIFYSALDILTLNKKLKAESKTNYEAREAEISQWLGDEEVKMKALLNVDKISKEELMKKFEALGVEADQQVAQFKEEVLRNKIALRCDIHTKRDKLVAEKLGLKVVPASIYAMEEAAEQEIDADFQKVVENLPLGSYQVGIEASDKQVAHAIAFIKSDNHCFIVEPNFATLAMSQEEAVKELWNVSKTFYLKEGLCSLTFYSVTK